MGVTVRLSNGLEVRLRDIPYEDARGALEESLANNKPFELDDPAAGRRITVNPAHIVSLQET
jgi:hypothetical protein